ncbi:MAG: winged helix-turn-helix domain-containing protein [Candidatus Bathyarchaeota archaeon]
MGKHRSRLRILAKILSVVNSNNGAKKTRIMYNAYLSYELLTRYLNDLLNANLVIYGDDDQYLLTDVGEEFLIKFEEYSRLNQDITKRVNYFKQKRLILEKLCPISSASNVNKKLIKQNEN